MVITLNDEPVDDEGRQLFIVWEFNPHYRGRWGWRLWSQVLPSVVVNKWFTPNCGKCAWEAWTSR